MAKPIARDYAGEVPVYLTVMHGALPFAGQLSLELGALVMAPSWPAHAARETRPARQSPPP